MHTKSMFRTAALGMATAAVLTFAGTTDASAWHRHHHHHHDWVGPAIVGGLALGALAASSYRRCWWERRVIYTRHGRVVQRYRVCG
jgi:integral membrane sensor domain MASE1